MSDELSAAAQFVLRRMHDVADFSEHATDNPSEWVQLVPAKVGEFELFHRLRFHWATIAATYLGQLALVYSRDASNAGVWLHDLSTEGLRQTYFSGSFEIDAWLDQRGQGFRTSASGGKIEGAHGPLGQSVVYVESSPSTGPSGNTGSSHRRGK